MPTPEARPFVRGNSSGGPFAADSSCGSGMCGGGCVNTPSCDAAKRQTIGAASNLRSRPATGQNQLNPTSK